jgi:3-hydroxyisobutyrate dehydrogenase-like beta-hydroxyacid dehydrogenase
MHGPSYKNYRNSVYLTRLSLSLSAIIEGGFPTHLPLQHMQKDLKLSLYMGDQLEQPLPLTASTNELFKHAKRLGYGEHDASAVYIRARF